MSDGNAEKAFIEYAPFMDKIHADQYESFLLGRASRDAEVAELKNDAIEWRRKFTDCHPIHLSGVLEAAKLREQLTAERTRADEAEAEVARLRERQESHDLANEAIRQKRRANASQSEVVRLREVIEQVRERTVKDVIQRIREVAQQDRYTSTHLAMADWLEREDFGAVPVEPQTGAEIFREAFLGLGGDPTLLPQGDHENGSER